MSKEELFQRMAQSIVAGDVDLAVALAQQSLTEGIDAADSVNQGYRAGLDEIGRGFETHEYFLPDLVLAGKAMEAAVQVLKPALAAGATSIGGRGKVVLATVEGDLHTIGKDLVGLMLSLNGFEVVDLGCDVPTAVVLERVREEKPAIVGLSCLLTAAIGAQRNVILGLEEMGVRESVKVLVGGAATTREWAHAIGADGYAADAAAAASAAREVLGN
jgi:corrinoid protein of di/trimethylamine methyltransferase